MAIYTMKFFWNGVKVNGVNKIIPMRAFYDENTASIVYQWNWTKEFYDDILELVQKEVTPPQYWGDDTEISLTVDKCSPLYKYFKFLADAHNDHYITRARMGRERLKCNGVAHMLASEKTIEEAKRYNAEKTAEKKAAEEAEMQAGENRRRAEFESEKAMKSIILKWKDRFPISDGSPVVRFCWSEHPAFYDWKDNELEVSLRAADMIFTELDKKPMGGGYYKTKFEIIESGDTIYAGRYDLGDEEGGLFKHMVNHAEAYKADNAELYRARLDFIEKMLDKCAECTEHKITEVKFSAALPIMIALYKAQKDTEDGAPEEG